MIDLHLHFLPGIDDGAPDLEASVEMCRMALADGCDTLIATPHQRHDRWLNQEPEKLLELIDRVREAVGPAPRLELGAEVRVDSELLDELDKGDLSGIQPLAGGHYLLIEFDRHGFGPEPLEIVHELALGGWRPIVAHPEFVPRISESPDYAARLVESGALLQVTAMSLTGDFGYDLQQLVATLVDRDLVHFVASDAHSPTYRSPGLGRARKVLADRWSEEVARRLTEENQLAVLQDSSITVAAGTP